MRYLFNPVEGKIGRAHWWLLQIAGFSVMIVAAFIVVLITFDWAAESGSKQSTGVGPILLVTAFLIYMNFSTCLNRLRDTQRSGWWYLAFMMPLIGLPCMIYFCGIEAGKVGATHYTVPDASVQNKRNTGRQSAQLFGTRSTSPV